MKRFARFVTGHPIVVLALVLLATVFALHGIVDLRSGHVRLEVDPGIDRLLPAGDEERRFYDRARELFGNDETLLLVLETEDVFQPEALAAGAAHHAERRGRPGHRARDLARERRPDRGPRRRHRTWAPSSRRCRATPAALAQLREPRCRRTRSTAGSWSRRTGARPRCCVTLGAVSDREFVERRLSEEVLALAQREARGRSSRSPACRTRSWCSAARSSRRWPSSCRACSGSPRSCWRVTFRTLRGVVLPHRGDRRLA